MQEGVSARMSETHLCHDAPEESLEYLQFFAKQAIDAVLTESEKTNHLNNHAILKFHSENLKDTNVSETHNPTGADVYRYYMHLGAQNKLPEAYEDLINAYEWLGLEGLEVSYENRRNHFLGGALLLDAAFISEDQSMRQKLLKNARKHFHDVRTIYDTTSKLRSEKGNIIYNPNKKWRYTYYQTALAHIYDIDMYNIHLLAKQGGLDEEQNNAINNYFVHKQTEFNELFQKFCKEGTKSQAGFIFEWMFLLGQRDKIYKSGLLGSMYARSALIREDFPSTMPNALERGVSSGNTKSSHFKQGFDALVQFSDDEGNEQSRIQIQLKCKHKSLSKRKYKRMSNRHKNGLPVEVYLTQFNLVRDPKTEYKYEEGIEVYRISTNIKEMQTRAQRIINDYKMESWESRNWNDGLFCEWVNKNEMLNKDTRSQFDQFLRVDES